MLQGTDFDLTDIKKWEHMLAGEPAEWRRGSDPDKRSSLEDEGEEEEEEDGEVLAEKHLDMPSSWVPRLDVQHAGKCGSARNG